MRAVVAFVLSALLASPLGAAPDTSKRRGGQTRKPAASKPPARPQQELWMHAMSLPEKVAQLLVIPFYGDNPPSRSRDYRKFAAAVGTLRVGGLILVNRSHGGVVQSADPLSTARFLNRMQRLARVPLIVGGDFERGASMRVNGPTRFPHAMAFAAARDLEATRRLGAVTARESRAIGVHWVFAPVADVNNNPDNPIINIRSFSENPDEVAAHVKAFLEGARSDPAHPVLLTVKHFPGHGDTAVDSHLGLGKVEASLERLRAVELRPFRAAIEAGVDSIMTAHLWVPAVEPEEIPATVSAKVLTGLLRQELGFSGIVTTDAMDMHGLSKLLPPGEAAVRALEAGADVLLMPPDPQEAVRAVVAAVRSGRLSRQRIEQSVGKLLRAKVALGLHKSRYVNPAAIPARLNLAEDAELALRVAGRAVTLVRNEGQLLPLAGPEGSCWFVLNESSRGVQGQELLRALEQRGLKDRSLLLPPNISSQEIEDAVQLAGRCATLVVPVFAGFRGTGLLTGPQNRVLEQLLALGKPLVMVGLGNPYLLRAYPQAQSFLATFSTIPFSEEAAIKAVLGEAPVGGRLPVTVPGVADYGAGLDLPAR